MLRYLLLLLFKSKVKEQQQQFSIAWLRHGRTADPIDKTYIRSVLLLLLLFALHLTFPQYPFNSFPEYTSCFLACYFTSTDDFFQVDMIIIIIFILLLSSFVRFFAYPPLPPTARLHGTSSMRRWWRQAAQLWRRIIGNRCCCCGDHGIINRAGMACKLAFQTMGGVT